MPHDKIVRQLGLVVLDLSGAAITANTGVATDGSKTYPANCKAS
ncbi:MAG: hypothetical protein PHS59_08935 [Paludibacter sp.]|nr:hypothetical protein [Paludibacter sp.]